MADHGEMDIAMQLATQRNLIELKCGKETAWIVDQAISHLRAAQAGGREIAERCAGICDAIANNWKAAVKEGTEVDGYETAVLLEAAVSIRAYAATLPAAGEPFSTGSNCFFESCGQSERCTSAGSCLRRPAASPGTAEPLEWLLVTCEFVRNGLVAEGRKESSDPLTCDTAVFNINSAINQIRAMLAATAKGGKP